MQDDIRFDYSRAANLFRIFNESKNCLDNANGALKNRLADIGQWWKGDSFDEFRQLFESADGIKPLLEALASEAAEIGGSSSKAADSKKDFETATSKHFR
jgi:uncharacterized protein YukE